MIGYFIIMLVLATVFAVLGAMIYKGKTNLIHDYHQTKIAEEDKEAYGKAFSNGIFTIAAGMLLSGIAELLNASKISVVILIAGIVIGIVIISKVQKKYNGGMF